MAIRPQAVHVSSPIALGLRLFLSILQEHPGVSINAIYGCLGGCSTSMFPTMRLPKETAQNIPMSPPAIPQAAFQIYLHIIVSSAHKFPLLANSNSYSCYLS